MNRKDTNVVDEASTVSAFMAQAANKQIWQGNQAIADVMTLIDGTLVALGGVGQKTAMAITGATVDKALLRDEYEEEVVRIGAQVAALGAKTKNATLEAEADWTISKLDDLSAETLVATGKALSKLVTDNLNDLVPYQITAADATILDDYAAKFDVAKTKPREAVVDRSKETKQVAALIGSLRSALHRQLDRLDAELQADPTGVLRRLPHRARAGEPRQSREKETRANNDNTHALKPRQKLQQQPKPRRNSPGLLFFGI